MNLSYHNTPFPHIEGSLDENLYNDVLSSWEELESVQKDYVEYAGNRCNITLKNQNIEGYLSGLCFKIHSDLMDVYLQNYPKLVEKEFRLDFRALYSENKASDTGYKIRNWHLDTGDKFLVGLWYFKHPDEEEDCGGDLLLMNPLTKEHKQVKYGSNKFIIFPNIPTAWHAVTPRKPSKYPRRYVNLLIESPEVTLHNYRRTASNVDDEFRGKLVNYYK